MGADGRVCLGTERETDWRKMGENREGDREGGNGAQETKTCKTTNTEGCRTSDVDIKAELKSVSGAFQSVPSMSNIVKFVPPLSGGHTVSGKASKTPTSHCFAE